MMANKEELGNLYSNIQNDIHDEVSY